LEEKRMKHGFRSAASHICRLLAILFAIFQIYTAVSVPFTAILQRSIHLMFSACLVFLSSLLGEEKRSRWKIAIDLLFLAASVVSMMYLVLTYKTLAMKIGSATPPDIVMGVIAIIIILEGTRRTLGIAMPMVAIFALLYAYFGNYLPGSFGHVGYSAKRISSFLYLTTDGIFGSPLGVSATVVAVFIIFGVLLEKTGAGEFIIQISTALLGRVRGGPAKVAIVASSFFGTISGSVVANVVGTGSFTIPMMKRTGFPKEFAAAVEAVASTGGMITPPVMGTVAFLIADALGISFWEVIKAAAIPALLYYTALFMAVDFRSGSMGMKGLDKSEIPNARKVFKSGWVFIIPIIALIIFMGSMGYTATKAGIWSCGILFIIALLRKNISLRQLFDILEAGGKGIYSVAMAMACSGIIIGAFTLTGLGMKLSSLLIQASGGYLITLLILTMIACLILGMGMTCTAAYIILSVLVAPALVDLGVTPIAAHMFVFHIGSLANVTPPVALGSYAAAAIADANPFKTGIIGMKLALPALLVPFLFVYNPDLIMQGTTMGIIWATFTGIIGVVMIAGGLQGFFFRHIAWPLRIVAFCDGLLMIIPERTTDIIGIAVGILLLAILWVQNKKTKQTAGIHS